jgi:hypothetical protein
MRRSSRVALCLVIGLVMGAAMGSAPAGASTSAQHTTRTISFPVATTIDLPLQNSKVGNNCIRAWLRVGEYGLADRRVHFAIFGVPIGSATTDQFGHATACAVFPLSLGTYPGAASAAFAGDGLFAPSAASNDFVVYGEQSSIQPEPVSAMYLESATFRARLTVTIAVGSIPGCIPTKFGPPCTVTLTLPLVGRTVFFYRVGVLIGSALTDADGFAVVPDISLNGLNAFQYPDGVTAVFRGDAYYAADTQSNVLFIEPQTTSLLVAPVGAASEGSTSLSALLRFKGGLPLADRRVVFYVNDAVVGTATTGSNGVATLEGVNLSGIDPGIYATGVKALFLGELNFRPTAGGATLTVGSPLG